MHIKKILFFCFLISNVSAQPLKKILIVGDSLTAGHGVSQEESYPSQLKNMLQEKKILVDIVNAGSSGSTSAGAFSRVNWHLKSKPDILILALGGNDGLRGISPKSTQDNLQKAIDLAKEKNLKIFLAGMKMPYNYGKEYQSEFEKVFQDLAIKNKIEFIPFLLEGVGGIASMNLGDGIHPNPQGHKKIAENVLKVILPYL